MSTNAYQFTDEEVAKARRDANNRRRYEEYEREVAQYQENEARKEAEAKATRDAYNKQRLAAYERDVERHAAFKAAGFPTPDSESVASYRAAVSPPKPKQPKQPKPAASPRVPRTSAKPSKRRTDVKPLEWTAEFWAEREAEFKRDVIFKMPKKSWIGRVFGRK